MAEEKRKNAEEAKTQNNAEEKRKNAEEAKPQNDAEEKRENAEEAKPQNDAEEPAPVEEKKEEAPPVEEVKAEEPPVEEKAEEKAPAEEKAEEPAAEEKAEEKAEEEAPRQSSGQAPEEEKPAVKVDKHWYVIQTLTGQEDKVKQAIDQMIESKKLKDKLFQVLVPTEDMVEIKGGKRVEKIRKMFPGYVFLEMVLDDESWFNIRNTPWVARFIGTKTRPTPVSDREMQRVLKQLGKEERLEVTFEKGEAVRVISGPFRGYTGTVDEVNIDKGKLKVLINIFGRDTPVEVNFEHAQKMI
jgi:transcriptional antiterminator NusG